MPLSVNGANGITFADGSIQNTGAVGFGFKNRLINGDMRIDQRNAGSALTSLSTFNYAVDRFRYTFGISSGATLQRVADAPAGSGFTYSNKMTCTTAQTLAAGQFMNFGQAIEGYNVADLMFGSTYAKTVTLSFWVKSSLTGTFGGMIGSFAGTTRAYVYQYDIGAANTWEYKTITIPGDTSSVGTYYTDNNTGLYVLWSLGDGSDYNGTANTWQTGDKRNVAGNVLPMTVLNATWQVTGVQLEKGSTATSFDYRPYNMESYLCKRYFQRSPSEGRPVGSMNGSSTGLYGFVWEVEMRAAPSIQFYGGNVAGGNFYVYLSGGATSVTSDNGNAISAKGMRTNFPAGSGYGSGATWIDYGTGSNQMGWTANAEL